MPPQKLLFICSRNRRRSPTAERIARRDPRCQARSAGTGDRARRRVSAADLRWADQICVMEYVHAARLRQRFRDVLEARPLLVLDIPDDFDFMDPELVSILEPIIDGLLEDS